MSRDTALRVASALKDAGVRGVVISGGEPTLLSYLPELVEALHRPQGDLPSPRVVLSTNGLAPPRAMERVLPNLSWIALPLESADAAEHLALRTGVAPHREKMLTLLAEVRKNHGHVKVKLGTVITRLNVGGAPDVLSLIDDACLPDVWKVYQMSETNYGADNRSWLSLGDEEFEDVVHRCEAAAQERGVTLRVYRNRTRTGSYFFIDPDCQVVVIDENGERRIGDFFERLAESGPTPDAPVTGERNAENFTGTYPDTAPDVSPDA
jgi:MoaA/NifB/PqqE/SkfB family radical SAM enzyme